jgi:hypothetical protein
MTPTPCIDRLGPCCAQVGAFAGCAAIIGVLFYWFNPSAVDDCSFNVGIAVFTIILCVLVAMAPLHPSVRRKHNF